MTFNCTADGIPRPDLRWFRDGILVSMANTNTRITTGEYLAFRGDIPDQNGIISSLTISPTNQDVHEGRYVCEATNSAGSKILQSPYILMIERGNEELLCNMSPDAYIGKCDLLITVPFFHFTVLVDYCESSPCQNGGMCENTEDSFDCLCVAVDGIQYSGVTCEESQFFNSECWYHGQNKTTL